MTFVKGPSGRKVPICKKRPTPRIVGRSRTHRLETHPPVETANDAEMERDLILRWVFPQMMVPPKHPKMIIFSRKTHGCWVPPFEETPILRC